MKKPQEEQIFIRSVKRPAVQALENDRILKLQKSCSGWEPGDFPFHFKTLKCYEALKLGFV